MKWIKDYNHFENLSFNVKERRKRKGQKGKNGAEVTNVLLTYIPCGCSFGFAATGGMDNKLIIWELQRSSSRCICEHEVIYEQIKIDD